MSRIKNAFNRMLRPFRSEPFAQQVFDHKAATKAALKEMAGEESSRHWTGPWWLDRMQVRQYRRGLSSKTKMRKRMRRQRKAAGRNLRTGAA